MVRGDGSTPVIFAPKQPAVDWKLYQAIEIRMSAQGGSEIKIKIGDFESKKNLGPVGQYNLYRFDVDVDAPKGSRTLAIMPTDSLQDAVAIHSIRLVPKPAEFVNAVGRQFIGKADEYRQAVYVRAPSAITFPVSVPKGARLHFGIGTTVRGVPVKFRISVEGSRELFSKVYENLDRWDDNEIDLTQFGGRKVMLRLSTEASEHGAVGLWANPVLTNTPITRPNILIYTIDTLRADHASLYGYERDTTPFLRKLGAGGIVFDDCQAQATWTKPSIASLMTSLYSFTHDIKGDADTIPAGSSTLAEQLRSAGYVTASIVSTPFVGRATGLERGFDYLLESPAVLRQHDAQTERDTDSVALNKVVFPWLDRHKDEGFFLYAHATDPHAPYNPPPPYDARFANPLDTAHFQRSYASFHTGTQYGGGAVVSPQILEKAGVSPRRFIEEAEALYDGEILHNDHSLELLTGKLKQLGVLDNTLLIVISDHGEEFLEHGWTAHGQSVYQELAHSLLTIWNPALAPKARRVSQPVQLIDVMPTLLDLLGLKTPPIAEGQSLLPLIRGQAFQRRGLVVSSRFAAVHPIGLVPENATDSFAIIDSKWKFIFRNKLGTSGMKRVELYDRSIDRAEKHDVAAQHPEEVERFTTAIVAWIGAQNKVRAIIGHAGTTRLDQVTLQQLRSLGYLGGSPQ